MVLVILLLVALGISLGLNQLHKSNVQKLNDCRKKMLNEEVDNLIGKLVEHYKDSNNQFNYVFNASDMPLGRVSAFLNFYGRSIYTEEPYLFLCRRSTKDNEFREYGYLFARTGIYISTELNKNSKSASGSKEESISFYGLMQVFQFGSSIVTVNVRPNKLFDRIHYFRFEDPEVASLANKVCRRVIGKDIGICLCKGNVVEVIESDEYATDAEKNENINEAVYDTLIQQERKLDGKGITKGINAAGVQAAMPKFQAFYGEVKHLMDGSRGHGYASEYANNTVDRVMGRSVTSAAQVLDEHGRQVKHGADRLVNGVEIQTKYYKTASETIGAVFEHRQAIYIRSDGSGKMMQIEVPRDQYQDALNIMQKRIDSGQVPNISPGESAKDYVRKGFFTYEQSFNVARSLTIESLSVDMAAGAVCCLGAAGISSAIIFAQALWRGETPREAMKECLESSFVIMGKGTLIYTLTMQLSRKETANVLAGKVFTKDGISQGYLAFTNPVYVFSESMASKIQSSALAKSGLGQKIGLDQVTGRQLIGNAVTVVVVFGPDVVRSLQGKISMKQLFKNSVIGAGGMAGAAIGQAAIPVPVVGAVIGGAIGGVASKKVMDQFIEDDAKEMFRILKEEFIDQTMLANLSQEEFDQVTELTVANKKLSKQLQKMYQSKEFRIYARESIMVPAIMEVTKKRHVVTRDEYNQALLSVALT